MIEVFKTNVQEVDQSIMIVGKLLEHHPNSAINFDLEDCDKILRINAASIKNQKIIELLDSYGYDCEVLLQLQNNHKQLTVKFLNILLYF